jgi:ribonucleoside-diphosphate reductase alpha chain
VDEVPDYLDINGDGFKRFIIIHRPFEEWMLNNNIDTTELSTDDLNTWFLKSPWSKSTAYDISPEDRIDIQSIVQRYTTHSISSTVNLKEDVTEDVVNDIYIKAWEAGLKGITCYRDKSREGILTSADECVLNSGSIIKRPKELKATLSVISSKGNKYAIIIGFLNNKPYEVFAHNTELVRGTESSGRIIKIKKGQYKYISSDNSIIIDQLQLKNDEVEEKACTLYMSMLLRHGADIPFIIKTAKKVDGNIVSFTSAVCRVLSKYTPKEEVQGETCPECGKPLVREAGCTKCSSCTYSKCLFIVKYENS